LSPSAKCKGDRVATAGLRALVVDDDPIMRDLVKSRLQNSVEEIVEAGDGLEAWMLLAKEHFHIAFVDLMMPHLNGFELIQCMRGHPRTKHLPIIALTSNDDRDSLVRALQIGASAFLTKPLTWSVFDTHVEHLLQLSASSLAADRKASRQQAMSDAHLRFSRLLLDYAQASLRDIAELSRMEAGPYPSDIQRCAILSSQHCRRIGEMLELVGNDAAVNSTVVPLDTILSAAATVSKEAIARRSITLLRSGTGDAQLLCSPKAIILSLVTAIERVIEKSPLGSIVELKGEAGQAGISLSIAARAAETCETNLEEQNPEINIEFEPARARDSFEIEIMLALVSAHGGTVRIDDNRTMIEIGLPPDRLLGGKEVAEEHLPRLAG
jgi:CheY-like chemotaxis protein